MNYKEFEKRVAARIHGLKCSNKAALKDGNFSVYQCNCDILVGINFVMSLLRNVEFDCCGGENGTKNKRGFQKGKAENN